MSLKLLILPLTFLLIFFINAQAQDICHSEIHFGNHYVGKTYCSSGEIKNIIVSGILSTTGTIIDDYANITGEANIKGGVIHNVYIKGDAGITNTTLDNSTIITGNLVATNTVINGVLTLHSPVAKLNSTTTQAINVDSDQNASLYLTASKVNGNIKFSSGHGTVYLSAGSVISGKVTGGKIIQQ